MLVDELVKFVKRVAAFTALLYLFLGCFAFYVYRESTHTTGALCALRGDLERRVQTSKDFLIDHPNGIPGISRKMILQSLANQEATIHALRGLSCSK